MEFYLIDIQYVKNIYQYCESFFLYSYTNLRFQTRKANDLLESGFCQQIAEKEEQAF
jgi:hypothetical protein